MNTAQMSKNERRISSPIKIQNGNTPKKRKLHGELLMPPSKDISTIFDDSGDFDFAKIDCENAVHSEKLLSRPQLDLTEWQRCIVDGMERQRRTFDLVLQLRKEGEPGSIDKENAKLSSTCHLQGPWSHTRLQIGDLVSVKAVWDEQLSVFKVDKDSGFCITQPDRLISGTTVVGALFCMRKAVLADRFRGLDAGNKQMIIGTVVHEVLQAVLRKGLTTSDEIQTQLKELLESREMSHQLYASGITREEMELELKTFIPNILSFIHEYVQGQEPAIIVKDTYQGQISEIQDIEENVWVPQLGLKGKIDVTVRVQPRRRTNHAFKNFQRSSAAIPLELKTGRASFSMEHKGQLILYQMMLTALGKETPSGLLLYLREGLMREIVGSRNEQRDLLGLRNELATFLSHWTRLPESENLNSIRLNATEPSKYMQPFDLPEPISHHSACEKCAYATICCSFARTEPTLQLRDNHPLRKVMQTTIAHLETADYDYFMHWCWLLALEEQEAAQRGHNVRTLWTESPAVRERHGRALIDLQLDGPVEEKESGRYFHNFIAKVQKTDQEKNNETDFTLSGFSIGEYVIVSTPRRLAIAAGWVHDLTKSSIIIGLERNLRTEEQFIVDKYDSVSGNVFNFTNLGILFEDTPHSKLLRQIVVHRRQPIFSKVLPKVVATKGTDILQSLNGSQRMAVLKALTTDTFLLIKGLPGTGKTQTLVALVRLLHLLGKSVVITSHTHSAVDNLLLRLKPYGVPMLRLGNNDRIHSELRENGETAATRNCLSEADLKLVYSSFPVVGVTCLGSGHSIFQHRRFDYCIVDEATQVLQAMVLRPLFFCDRFVLVGDPEQLAPLVYAREARANGADVSLFERLDTSTATAVLNLQYRMNSTITRLANELTYGGALRCGSSVVEAATLKLKSSLMGATTPKWLQRALESHFEMSVFMLDTLDCSEISSTFATTKHKKINADIERSFAEDKGMSSTQTLNKRRSYRYTNYAEAAVVFRVVRSLLIAGQNATGIGIISPYRAQVELLKKLAAQYHTHFNQDGQCLNFAGIEVNTVDQYQGRDKDIIIYSCTRTGHDVNNDERKRNVEILEDKRRLTVAITRSRVKLLLVGDAHCLQQYSPFRSLLAFIPTRCRLRLEEGKQGFAWSALLDELSTVIGSCQ